MFFIIMLDNAIKDKTIGNFQCLKSLVFTRVINSSIKIGDTVTLIKITNKISTVIRFIWLLLLFWKDSTNKYIIIGTIIIVGRSGEGDAIKRKRKTSEMIIREINKSFLFPVNLYFPHFSRQKKLVIIIKKPFKSLKLDAMKLKLKPLCNMCHPEDCPKNRCKLARPLTKP